MDDEGLSRREAAERLGLHYNTIRVWEKKGLLRTIRVMHGRQEEVRVPMDEIERLEREITSGVRAQSLLNPPGNEWVATLEAEVRLLREELKVVRGEKDKLLDALLERK